MNNTKTKEALFFVRKVKKNKYPSAYADKTSNILFAVVNVPERTKAPIETAHYVLYSGNRNTRHKMRINTVTFTAKDGKSVVETCTPNFEKVEGTLLQEMYSKCSPAFKKRFPLK